jgi:phytanoyl-CoA hydroxylase
MSLTSLGPSTIAQRLYRYERVHTPIASPGLISDEHVREYRERGFIAVDQVFSPDEVETYKQAITDLIAQGDPRVIQFEDAMKGREFSPAEREAYVRKCMGFVQYEPRLKAMSEHPVLHAIMERLIGEKLTLSQDMALLKPPHVGREKPWHQDMAYFQIDPPTKVIGTWTALDRATPENGCMHMIPGSHQLGPKPHYHDRDCQLADEDVDVDRDVMVPLKPGGVLFFSALIHHGTPPNQSAARRRAVQLHYSGVSCRKITVEEHGQLFHDAVGYAGCRQGARPITSRPEDI